MDGAAQEMLLVTAYQPGQLYAEVFGKFFSIFEIFFRGILRRHKYNRNIFPP